MDKKKYGILAAVVVLVVAGILLFGNMSADDVSGHFSKIDSKGSAEHTLNIKNKNGASTVEVNKKKKVSNVEVKGDGNLVTEVAEGVDSGFLAGLRTSCEEDKNGDGLSDNEYILINGILTPVAVADCEDWAFNQVQAQSGAEAAGQSLAECKHACGVTQSSCYGEAQTAPTEAINQNQEDSCDAAYSSCIAACSDEVQ